MSGSKMSPVKVEYEYLRHLEKRIDAIERVQHANFVKAEKDLLMKRAISALIKRGVSVDELSDILAGKLKNEDEAKNT
jgi:hypothetical protein